MRRSRSSQHSIILGVGADPEPLDAITFLDGQRAVVEPDANGPKDVLNALELKRGMSGIVSQKRKAFISTRANLGRQTVIERPEFRVFEMAHDPLSFKTLRHVPL